jgi:hypothetical protein
MITNIPWPQPALNLFFNKIFDLLMLFPNIWILPPFQDIYYKSSYCEFILHSDLETWPCTYFYHHLLLIKSPYYPLSKLLHFSLYYVCFLAIYLLHQHKPEADLYRLISVNPGLLEPSLMCTLKPRWKVMAIKQLLVSSHS